MKAIYSKIVITSNLRLDRIKRERKYASGPVIYWDGSPLFAPAIRIISTISREVLIDEHLVDAWNRHVGSPCKTFKAKSHQHLPVDRPEMEASSRPVLFCPSNDTHTIMFKPIADLIENKKFLHFHHGRGDENTERALSDLNLDYVVGTGEVLEKLRPSVIVLGNDWNEDSVRLQEIAWKYRIPVVCIQEGCLDFGTTLKRMELCDWPFVLGPVVPQYLNQKGFFLTGNPRFDTRGERPLPSPPQVMINSNFTYGVHEEVRHSWVRDVVSTCEQLSLRHFISKHPRDSGEFPDWPTRNSSPSLIDSHLNDCSILITRFSTLIYEAMLRGRKCIYYNPHGESMYLFNNDETGGLQKASNKEDLRACLLALLGRNDSEPDDQEMAFLNLHCGPLDGNAAKRCASAIEMIRQNDSPHGFSYDQRMRAFRRRRISLRIARMLGMNRYRQE